MQYENIETNILNYPSEEGFYKKSFIKAWNKFIMIPRKEIFFF